MAFPLVERYLGTLLGADLPAIASGPVRVVESARRLRCESSYGFVHAALFLRLQDGRGVLSVPPGAGPQVQAIADAREAAADAWIDACTAPIQAAVAGAGLDAPEGRWRRWLIFACHAPLLRGQTAAHCHRITDDAVPPAEGLWMPSHCLPDGIVYGVVEDGRVVSVAYAHRSGIMEDCIADLGVETAPACRRRGYAASCVAAVIGHIAQAGGEAVYSCNPDNAASIATARSVGCALFAQGAFLKAEAPAP